MNNFKGIKVKNYTKEFFGISHGDFNCALEQSVILLLAIFGKNAGIEWVNL